MFQNTKNWSDIDYYHCTPSTVCYFSNRWNICNGTLHCSSCAIFGTLIVEKRVETFRFDHEYMQYEFEFDYAYEFLVFEHEIISNSRGK